VAELISGVRKIKSPTWSKVGSKLRNKVAPAHSCRLNEFFEPVIKQVENDLNNLSLYDVGLKSMADSAYQHHTACILPAVRRVQSVHGPETIQRTVFARL
jgi:hypothetical protein